MEDTTEPTASDGPPGDPTQRLLTALGRFQRQIARARDGLPQEAWSDECMSQLIDAVEIALSQGWKDVVETLTETGRVLQSYEDAGKADECIAFLNDSYEILCLMVGDLIVGKVRSRVIDKWRARYQRALDDLAAAGITLVHDEGEALAVAAEPPPALETVEEPLAETPEEAELAAVGAGPPDMDQDVPEEAEEDMPGLEDLPPLNVDSSGADQTAGHAAGSAPEPGAFDEVDIPDLAAMIEGDSESTEQPSEPIEIAAEEVPDDSVFDAFTDASPETEEDKGTTEVDIVEELRAQEAAVGKAEDSKKKIDDLDEAVESLIDDLVSPEEGPPVPLEPVAPPSTPPAADEGGPFPEEQAPEPAGVAWERDVELEEPADTEELVPVAEEPVSEGPGVEEEVKPLAPSGVTGRRDLPEEIVEVLDKMCDELSRFANKQVMDVRRAAGRVEHGLAHLERHARESERNGAILPCLAMRRMVRLVAEREAVPDDRFFELAYAFCGLYAEAGDASNTRVIQEWLSECDDLLVSWASHSRREEPAAVGPETMVPADEEAEIAEEAPEGEAMEEEPEAVAEADREVEEEAEMRAAFEAFADQGEEPAQPPEPPEVQEPLGALEPLEQEEPVEEPAEELEPLEPLAVEKEPAEPVPAGTASSPDRGAEEPSEEIRSLQHMLETAQQALTQGNVANAKLLALQAAASIAETQIEEARKNVEQGELRLQRGAELSEEARAAVTKCEQVVNDTEAQVAADQEALKQAQAHVEVVAGEVGHVQALIKEIDDQIAALQVQRDDAVQQKVATEARLAETQTVEEQTEADLNSRKKSEMEARVDLEDARQRVKVLEKKQDEHQEVLGNSREVLNQRRASLADIQATIAQITGTELAGEGEGDELLF